MDASAGGNGGSGDGGQGGATGGAPSTSGGTTSAIGGTASGTGGTSMSNLAGSSGAAGMTAVDDGGQDNNATATQLLFQVQPSDGGTSAALSPAVTVAAVDAHGNVVTGATPRVTISLDASSNTTGATLTGTTTVSASAGVATFSDIAVSKTGTGYRLIATATGLTPTTSDSFDVAAWRYVGPDGANVVALGSDGTNVYAVPGVGPVQLYKSTDSGKTWMGLEKTLALSGPIVVSPSNPKTLYAGANGHDGAFLRSTDGGVTWSGADTGLNGSVSGIAVDPANDTIYVVSGFTILYSSSDGGDHWTGTPDALVGVAVAIAVNPKTAGNVYAGGPSGVSVSTDSGAHWKSIVSGLTNKNVLCLAIDPANPSALYAGTDGGLFRSTNGGAAWTQANKGISPDGQTTTTPSIEALAVAATTPTTVYASAYALHQGADTLYKSTDGGNSWTLVTAGVAPSLVSTSDGALFAPNRNDLSVLRVDANGTISSSAAGFHNGIIDSLAADRSMPGTVLAGTVAGVAKTADGITWTKAAGITGADIVSMAFVPGSPDVYVVDGKVPALYASADDGSTFRSIKSYGTLPTRISVGATTPSLVLLGTEGVHVVVSNDRGVNWAVSCDASASACPNGLPAPPLVDPTNRMQIYVSALASGPSVALSIFRSTDEGAHFTQPNSTFSGLLVAVDEKGVLYAQDGSNIYRSADQGKTWSTFPGYGATKGLIDPKDPNTWYFVSSTADANNNLLIKTSNAGTSFEQITPPLASDTQISAIEMDGSGRLYVGTDHEGVYQTASGGK
jgi:photosystem II stability/assembly factor-like uncharacterized protein